MTREIKEDDKIIIIIIIDNKISKYSIFSFTTVLSLVQFNLDLKADKIAQ